ncbi:MAG: OmpA family protein [Pelistega sp.]|nr:OmpA family protein [Pelistega sp.]
MNKKKLLLTLLPILLTACAPTQKDWKGSGHLRIHQDGTAATNPNNFVSVNWDEFSNKLLTDKHIKLGIEASPVHDGGLRIVLPSSLIRPNNHIHKKADSVLKTITEEMKERPPLRVKIVGHMTSNKNDQRNQANSLQFAYQAAQKLIGYGVRSSRIEVEGRGSLDPLVSQDAPSSKNINRRIEIYLYQLR